MKPLFLDFESYYDDEFSLKKITPIEYINSPQFEALGCGFITPEARFWVDGPDLDAYFKTVDWANTFAVSHNALFDMLIIARRYGHVPAMAGCTLSMARNWLSHSLKSVSLASVAAYYGLPAKMETVQKTKGINYYQLRQTPELYAEVRQYALDDTDKCQTIFMKMIGDGFPHAELETIDMVIRMATQPKFELDMTVLSEHLAHVKADKQALLDKAMIDADNVSALMSDQVLAAQLFGAGVRADEIPMKISKKTGKEQYAFAKTDREFLRLLDHDEPMVQALVAARLGVKSTLEETRTTRLLAIGHVVDKMPIPLKYSGAHTHRFSGDWKINAQNLPRGGELRKAFRAPKGHVVVAVDASQIEARINATLSGQHDLIAAFRKGIDVYCEFAEIIYGYDIDKRVHKIERFVGKTGILSLGYGSSAEVFMNMCRIQGGVHLTIDEAIRIVQLYRIRYAKIQENWNYAHKQVLPLIANGLPPLNPDSVVYNPDEAMLPSNPMACRWPVEILRDQLVLPNGNRLRYRELHHEIYNGSWTWLFKRGEQTSKIYGAKLVENVTQSLAGLHIVETAKRVKRLTNDMLFPQHQVHDELIYVVPESVGEQVMLLVTREMSRAPDWLPNAPLAAEGHIGETYFDAK